MPTRVKDKLRRRDSGASRSIEVAEPGTMSRLPASGVDPRRALLEQVVLQSIAGGSGARGDAQLAIEGGGMVVDGAGTEHQVSGNLGIRQALGYQAQHLHLAGRQSRGRGG